MYLFGMYLFGNLAAMSTDLYSIVCEVCKNKKRIYYVELL